MKHTSIVIGLGFGDEGKGMVTDFLAKNSHDPIVIRFNGGPQAGHTVVNQRGQRHVFSNFGAGTFRGAPTYWSSYCAFSPEHFLEELNSLRSFPSFFLDKFSPITTHYDVLFNRAKEVSRGTRRHGSTGLGFGATVDRHLKNKVWFTAADLLSVTTFRKKLKGIKAYYRDKVTKETNFSFNMFDHAEADRQFERAIGRLLSLRESGHLTFVEEQEIIRHPSAWQSYIFEGAQGILLDQTFGKRPFVTKSNTTSQNALSMLGRYCSAKSQIVDIYYVTRAYLTRHGNGPFDKYVPPFELLNNENETNVCNEFQGQFKINALNVDLLYAPGQVRHMAF